MVFSEIQLEKIVHFPKTQKAAHSEIRKAIQVWEITFRYVFFHQTHLLVRAHTLCCKLLVIQRSLSLSLFFFG